MSHAVPSSASLAKRAKIDETDMVNTQAKSAPKKDEPDEEDGCVALRDPYEPGVLSVFNASHEESTRITDIIVKTSRIIINADSSDDDDTGSAGGLYKCQTCRESCLRKGFLLNEEQADWCGKLYGVCIEHRPVDLPSGMF